jgi:NUMOD4 motif
MSDTYEIIELWEIIPDFPKYQISNFGRILNTYNGRFMKPSKTNHGHLKISLIAENGSRHTRSVAQLVGEAFVLPPNAMATQIVLLDGNLENVASDNIVWRPPWYAWKYRRQLLDPVRIHYQNLPVLNIVTRVEYASIVDAGISEGLLFEDIWRSTYSGDAIYPYGAIFEIIKRV